MSAYQSWAGAEDSLLRQHADWPVAQLALALERTPDAVLTRLSRLHIRRPRPSTTHCKRCGAERYAGVSNVLCEAHYLDYERARGQRRRAKESQL